LTEEGALVKIDLTTNKVVQRLEIGGELAMGSFVENEKEGSHNGSSASNNTEDRNNTTSSSNDRNSDGDKNSSNSNDRNRDKDHN
jgi:hypothetical protein